MNLPRFLRARPGRTLAALALLAASRPAGAGPPPPPSYVSTDPAGRLAYLADGRGNRIPDFSHAGYMGGGVAIPDLPVRVVVGPAEGDDGGRIQAAIDYVAQLHADEQGRRGAVLLTAGRYEVSGSLVIAAGGVALRGQGDATGGTVLVATGTGRRPLIRIEGRDDLRAVPGKSAKVADAYVPVGSNRLTLSDADGFRVGDAVQIDHPSTPAWVGSLGMDRFPPGDKGSYLSWQPGKMDLRIDRVIAAIDGATVTLDAPLTTALDAKLAQATLSAYEWPGRIGQIGVENLRCESVFAAANPLDEQHSWVAIRFQSARDCWVRQVTAAHFAGSAVAIWEGCKGLTVEDCNSVLPVSEPGGYRRHAFYCAGQLTLFQRCRSERGRHDFAVGPLAQGPNVFLECESAGALGFSGPIESYASGVLYDNITMMDGGGLSLTNREIDGQGVGWAAANSVLWQCMAPVITCRKPPGAQNWAIGCWGQFLGDGAWQMPNEFVKPDSLYRAQLAERLGREAIGQTARRPIPDQPGDAPGVESVAPARPRRTAEPVRPLALRDGWLTVDGRLVVGGRLGTTWWRGSVLPSRAREFGPGLTRFVPGRDGDGYTDDLDELTDRMKQRNKAALEHHWGLWYDRRRDDHEMVHRNDGDVWPPFYEQPWARSGRGTAWDGLSKYDLESFNPWYFGRLAEFAGLCDRKGLVLIHQAYFQHNILEAGAHWADFPWRSANCLQPTGFPEPPPYENRKRIFMAKEFYDLSHPVRRPLHRLYIRKCLDTLGDHPNVVFVTGDEYTGPAEFVRFWLDTVVEWERETGKDVLIGLSCTRDVQDAVLADPDRRRAVSAIEMKYWWYTSSGTVYAPEGDKDLSPRQHYREWRGDHKRSVEQTARQIREYRLRYPDKAVFGPFEQADPWGVVAAGGSLPELPSSTDPALLAAIPRMQPVETSAPPARQWALAEPGRQYLVYATPDEAIRLDLPDAGARYRARRIDRGTGRAEASGEAVVGGRVVEFPSRGSGPVVLWLVREIAGDGPRSPE